MGLLSNPKQRKKIVDAISRYNNILCALCYIGGVLGFLALAYQPLNARTYFSENALLPGVVESGFYFDTDYTKDLEELKEELKKDRRNVPRDWVFQHFRDIGLDTYVQNYTIKYPLHIARGQVLTGQNVYGILRARRTASTEAIVLSVPFRAKSSDFSSTNGGIILMFGLAKHFMRQPYWSKDIIFLVTDHEQIGIQAWLDGYHEVDSEYIIPGELPGRSGPIQAALNLEIPEGNIKYFNVKMEGLNGQLPNLDLVNLVVRLCHRTGVEIMLHNTRDPPDWEVESVEGFQKSLTIMGKMMWAQATGLPSGNHGLFHRYHIEAVTLEGIRKKKSGRVDIQTAGRIVEGICRSLNNLLERFHQSFFFYILPGTERYVSIGLYMIPFGILCASGLVKYFSHIDSAGAPSHEFLVFLTLVLPQHFLHFPSHQLLIPLRFTIIHPVVGDKASERILAAMSEYFRFIERFKEGGADHDYTECLCKLIFVCSVLFLEKQEFAIALWVSKDLKVNATESKEKETSLEKDMTEKETNEEKEINEMKEMIGKEKDEEEEPSRKLNKETLKTLVNEETEEIDDDDNEDNPKGFISIIPLLFTSVLMGLLCYSGPEMLAGMAVPFKMNIEDGIFFGYLALFTASLLFPKMVARKTSDDKKLVFDWMLLKSVNLIFQSLMLYAIALMNISLAFFLAVLTVPASLIVHPSHSRLSRWGQKLLLLLISPLSMLFIAAVIETSQEKQTSLLHLVVNSWNGLSRGLLLCMVDRYLFGSTMFTLFSFAILPNWLTLWGISFCDAP